MKSLQIITSKQMYPKHGTKGSFKMLSSVPKSFTQRHFWFRHFVFVHLASERKLLELFDPFWNSVQSGGGSGQG